MVSYVVDRVCETTITTGTGNITLAGAVAGFRTFASTSASGAHSFYYLIEAVDANGVPTGDWEIGVGTCPTTTTLQRLAVIQSSNSAALVSFAAGTKRVHLTAPAYQIGWAGANAYMSTDLTAHNFTTAEAVSWGGTNPDTDGSLGTGTGFWDVANPTRLTLPALGYDQAICKLSAQVSLTNITVADWVELKIRLDGSTVIAQQTFYVPKTAVRLQIMTPQINTAGSSDYFEILIQVGADTSVDLLSADTFFQLEVVQ